MPTAVDLVTDLPADFEVFGQAVDTRLKALQPGTTLGDLAYSSATANTNTRLPIGTTGQVLAVVGGVPAWATTADQTPLTTKGDLFTFDTADARLGVGANGTVLTADSAEGTGLKWAAPAGGANWTLVNAGGTALTGAATVTVSGITGADKLLVIISAASSASASSEICVRINTDTGSNYFRYGVLLLGLGTYSEGLVNKLGGSSDRILIGKMTTSAASVVDGAITITGGNSSGVKVFSSVGNSAPTGAENGQQATALQGYYNSASTISSVSAFSLSGNFDAGTIFVYKSA